MRNEKHKIKFNIYKEIHMTKQDIIRKLSSRKFWACVSGFAVSVMAMFSFPENTVTLVTSLITSAGCLVAYILAEGYSDGKNVD